MHSASTFVASFSTFHGSHTLRASPLSNRTVCAPVRGARRARKHATIRASTPLEVDSDTFEQAVLKQSETMPVLVDFYAEWCGPCKLVAPLMDWAAAEFDGDLKVCKVDTDKNDRFVSEYSIRGLPTFAVFKKGTPYGLKEGAMGKDELERYIVEYMKEDA